MAQKANKFTARTDSLSLGKFWVDHKIYDFNPPYQREGYVWSDDKKRFFIDSLVNRYDTPKIYLHDTRDDNDDPYGFHVIDGKQRLTTILDFRKGAFSLEDKKGDGISVGDNAEKAVVEFTTAKYWEELSDEAREYFNAIALDVVLITGTDEEGIEEQFSRLNNGESLNNAEKRNAIGGDMNKIIRKIADHSFIQKTCSIKIKRYNDRELATKFLIIEENDAEGKELVCDLTKKNLDALVEDNKNMNSNKKDSLERGATECLNYMDTIFATQGYMLNRVTHIPAYYLFIKNIRSLYGHPKLPAKLQEFFPKFWKMRNDNQQKSEDERDRELEQYGETFLKATSNKENMKIRLSILVSWFLRLNPDVEKKVRKRFFSEEEKRALFALAGGRCQGCERELIYADMHADHIKPYAHGGETTLKNAQCLCQSCNLKKGAN